jgi:hypothetical protein
MTEGRELFIEAIERALQPEARRWFLEVDPSVGPLMHALASVPRQLRDHSLAMEDLPGLGWLLRGTSDVELIRVTLVARAAAAHAGERAVALLSECLRQGDNAEKRSVLRSLALVPFTDGLVEVGRAGCRTNARDVFEAISCENPFPADHFPDEAFNQMILKALFIGVPLARVVGVDRRRNAELSRMARDYASERRAAARSVPEDIQRVS